MLLPLLLLTTTQFGPGSAPLELHHLHLVHAPSLVLLLVVVVIAHRLYKHNQVGREGES